jgi:hypothetical protein
LDLLGFRGVSNGCQNKTEIALRAHVKPVTVHSTAGGEQIALCARADLNALSPKFTGFECTVTEIRPPKFAYASGFECTVTEIHLRGGEHLACARELNSLANDKRSAGRLVHSKPSSSQYRGRRVSSNATINNDDLRPVQFSPRHTPRGWRSRRTPEEGRYGETRDEHDRARHVTALAGKLHSSKD